MNRIWVMVLGGLSMAVSIDAFPQSKGAPSGGVEDKFTFRSTATRGSDGLMTSANVQAVGSLHGCFGATADPLVFKFYAEGVLGTISFKVRA